jgi:hypothetical protein
MSGFIGSVDVVYSYVIVNEAILGGWQCHLIQFLKQTLVSVLYYTNMLS